ncbi:MFS transporter [Streptomyces chiangmaiensis]|uniref:MFS transporter n=1 Tax=Streptomyces chiangmaiensis TaxID=766497 RepID=A0ABU7FRU9_9ACTN|nr:MFS transporter [Streptomyces chiangmaiensis]MED7826841.1 MFS transporter [Streptomyces chiangmaiensis]
MSAQSTVPGVKRGTVPVFATATAIAVANIYFTQPLLEQIARDLRISSSAAGIIATAGQIGYALGIVAIVPLADRVRLRRLTTVLLAVTALALLAGALAPSIALLGLATFVLSTTTVVPQVIMPTIASMSAQGQTGRALGAVGTGLTLGALLSRTVSGALSEVTGTWRVDYFAAALATGCLLFVLPRYMPKRSPAAGATTTGYLKLLASIPPLVVRYPTLRLSALLGSVSFAAFSSFWATLAFHLSEKPLQLGPAAAGLFGLSSVPGALAARYSGRLSDRYSPDTVNAIALASAGTAFVVFLLGGESLAALMIGCNLLGYGTTSAQIANQTRVFTGPAAIRARLNTVYIFSLFAGGAIGSAVGIAVFEAHGWTAMVYIGMAYLAVGALLLTGHAHAKRRTSVVPAAEADVGAARPAPAVSERR